MANETTKPKMPIWKILLNMIAFVIMLSLFIFSIIMNAYPQAIDKMFDGNITVMDSNSMGRDVRKGALVAYKKIDITNLAVGDIIVYTKKEGANTVKEVRIFSRIEKNSFGEESIYVKNVLGQEEGYTIKFNAVLGKMTKSISTLGAIYEVLTNQYAMLAYALLMFIIIFSPIVFAKVDYSRQLARKMARLQEKDDKKQEKLSKRAEKNGDNKMVFYDYKIESVTEKEQELDKIAEAMQTQKVVKRARPVLITFIIVLTLAIIFYAVMLVFNYSNINLQVVEYQYDDIQALPDDSGNLLKSIKNNSLVEYDNIMLNTNTLKQGDVLVVKVSDGDNFGYSVRYFYSAEPQSDVMYYYTYGVTDAAGVPILDEVKLSDDQILGVYRNHNNSLGKVYEFIISDIMFALVCLLGAFLLLMCIYYKINNRIIYMKPLSEKSRDLLTNAEKTITVKSVSVSYSHKTVIGLISTLCVIVVALLAGLTMWQVFDCDFIEVTSSKSSNQVGAYSLIRNNKTNLKIGDEVLVQDYIATNKEQSNLVASKYIIDIVGDYFVVGSKKSEADFILVNGIFIEQTVSRNQIYGKQIFALQSFDKVIARLTKPDMIAIYIAAPLLIILTMMCANAWQIYERKKKGVVQNVLGNTFVEYNAKDLEKLLRKARINKKLKFCEDNARVAFNEIKNYVLSYNSMKTSISGGKEKFYCKGRHILTLEIKDSKLYAYTGQHIQKYEGIFEQINKVDTYKARELRTKILIPDVTAAQEFNNIFEGNIVAMRVHKNVKYKPKNYSNAYNNKGVITLNVLAREVTSSIR